MGLTARHARSYAVVRQRTTCQVLPWNKSLLDIHDEANRLDDRSRELRGRVRWTGWTLTS